MIDELTQELDESLTAHANQDTKVWWERYMKGEATFRGVKMAAVRATVKRLVRSYDLDTGDAGLMLAIAHRWFGLTDSEDKLAAVLLLAEHCVASLTIDHVDQLALPLHNGDIHDWNVCDWYCVKLLGPFIVAGNDTEARATEIAGWSRQAALWQRRAGAVAFVNHVAVRPEIFEGATELILDVCERNATDERRWAQTSVGWVLRELSREEPTVVAEFLRTHPDLSTEARRNASKYLK